MNIYLVFQFCEIREGQDKIEKRKTTDSEKVTHICNIEKCVGRFNPKLKMSDVKV